MLRRFLSRGKDFFSTFEQLADQIVLGAHQFRIMVGDLQNSQQHCAKIKEIEHRGDDLTHQTVESLHKVFIIPLDRQDAHRLISRLDDILDHIDAAAQRVYLYQIKQPTSDLTSLAEICVRAAEFVKVVVHGLSNLKRPEDTQTVCVEINRLENEADQVLRSALANLFVSEPDTRQLIKLKEIYELLESVTDRCEDVANIIDGIILEYAG